MKLRHIILFFLMAVSVTPIRAGILTDYLLGGALTLKNGRIDKCYFEGGFARAFETSATTDRFVFYYYNRDAYTRLPTTIPSAHLMQTRTL